LVVAAAVAVEAKVQLMVVREAQVVVLRLAH
jgi:hypothetical protein